MAEARGNIELITGMLRIDPALVTPAEWSEILFRLVRDTQFMARIGGFRMTKDVLVMDDSRYDMLETRISPHVSYDGPEGNPGPWTLLKCATLEPRPSWPNWPRQGKNRGELIPFSVASYLVLDRDGIFHLLSADWWICGNADELASENFKHGTRWYEVRKAKLSPAGLTTILLIDQENRGRSNLPLGARIIRDLHRAQRETAEAAAEDYRHALRRQNDLKRWLDRIGLEP